MIKRFFLFFLVIFIFLSSFEVVAIKDVTAKSAILIEAGTLRTIYEKNADEKRGMASTTKIMTALVALENAPLDKIVTVSGNAAGTEGSSIYLVAGEKISLRDLLYGLMLNSGNDAAIAVAEGVAGSVDKFVKLMNKKAKDLRLFNTSFANPNGLDNKNNYTTARELAILTVNALKNPEFKKIVSTKAINGSLYGEKNRRRFVNHNRLIRSYNGCIGVKTGFTKALGRCLVSAAERNDIRLVAVTLNAPNDWKDHTSMLNFGFEILKKEQIEEKNAVTVEIPVAGTKKKVEATNANDIYGVFEGDLNNVRRVIEAPHFLFAEVKSGQICGYVKYYSGDILIAAEPLYAKDNINKPKDSIFIKFKKLLSRFFNASKNKQIFK